MKHHVLCISLIIILLFLLGLLFWYNYRHSINAIKDIAHKDSIIKDNMINCNIFKDNILKDIAHKDNSVKEKVLDKSAQAVYPQRYAQPIQTYAQPIQNYYPQSLVTPDFYRNVYLDNVMNRDRGYYYTWDRNKGDRGDSGDRGDRNTNNNNISITLPDKNKSEVFGDKENQRSMK